MKKEIDYERIASAIMFGGAFSPSSFGIEYRKGKTIEDVRIAIKKALKNGHGKTECELSMMELYVKDVFKQAKSISP